MYDINSVHFIRQKNVSVSTRIKLNKNSKSFSSKDNKKITNKIGTRRKKQENYKFSRSNINKKKQINKNKFRNYDMKINQL